jgi:fructokinase
VADTVGAGDAFAAALVHGLSRRWTAAATAKLANRIAAGVASRADSLPTT